MNPEVFSTDGGILGGVLSSPLTASVPPVCPEAAGLPTDPQGFGHGPSAADEPPL